MARATVVLTRPHDDCLRVAAALGPDIPVVITPVTEISGTGATVDLTPYSGIILTSANAIPFLPPLTDMPAYCVGKRTAEASGADVRLVAENADDLVARLSAPGPLLHAHGVETRGEIAKRLNSARIETHSCAIYQQTPCALTDEGKATLEDTSPAILPLWSPRSAQRLRDQLTQPGPNLHVIALSPAVAEAWGGPAEICDHADGSEMIARIVAAAKR